MTPKTILIICDGLGEGPAGPGNAVTLANTPCIDEMRRKHPYGLLEACGEAVGLTAGSMGGSEVGHFTIGSGRVTPQFLLAINWAVKDGSFFQNPALKGAFEHAKANQKKLHLLGMISDKGVHSHLHHLFALLEWAKKEQIDQVYVHAIADGRDVEERSVKQFIDQLEAKMRELGVGKLATLAGRYFGMDRDSNWDRTEKAYRLLTLGEGQRFDSASAAVNHFYAQDAALTDYYLPSVLLDENGLVESGDAVIFFNYRTDRTRQLTAAFDDSQFTHFQQTVQPVHFVCMGPYSKHSPIAFDSPPITNNLADWLSAHDVSQLRIAETEKYAHVTYFFNSQVEHAKKGEDRILVPSRKVSSFSERPEMSAPEITEKAVQAMSEGKHQVIIVNYANCDLVGHSGDLPATIKAVEAIDAALGAVYQQAMASGYTLMLTGDHGNADDMLYPDGSQKPSHSMNPVILLIADPENKITHVESGGLADVAPTLLKIIGLPQPEEMTGKALVS